MRRQWFYILLSLAQQDRHGSAIMRDVLELTGGDLRLWPVTLYGSIEELTEHQWIREVERPAEVDEPESGSGRSRWFRLTPAGRRALSAEVTRLGEQFRLARQRLAPGGELT
jgi:DNA-binding PadR family transcriptional regulator